MSLSVFICDRFLRCCACCFPQLRCSRVDLLAQAVLQTWTILQTWTLCSSSYGDSKGRSMKEALCSAVGSHTLSDVSCTNFSPLPACSFRGQIPKGANLINLILRCFSGAGTASLLLQNCCLQFSALFHSVLGSGFCHFFPIKLYLLHKQIQVCAQL